MGSVLTHKNYKKLSLFAMATALLVLTGCGLDEMSQFRCPSPVIVATADSWPSPADKPDFEVKIRGVQSTCSAFVTREVESDTEIAGYLDLYNPQQAPRSDFSVDIFVAAVAPDDTILAELVETVEIDGTDMQSAGPAGNFTHEFNTMRFMLAEGQLPGVVRLLVGFRLSQDQLAGNRERRKQRLSSPDLPSQ
jgi:hypothetical protein